jgi:putative membrane protein
MNRTVNLVVAVAFGALLPLAGMAVARQNNISRADDQFAMKAAQGNRAEVEMGKLALQRGSSEVVKNFARRMVEDHTKALDQLKDVAGRQNLNLPSGLDTKDQLEYDRLSKLSGTDFDRAYARDMLDDHQLDISAFQKEANSGTDPSLKNYASGTLPTLEEHLRLAQEMENQVGGH